MLLSAFFTVYRKPCSWFITISTAWIFLTTVLWYQNWSLIVYIMGGASQWWLKVSFLLSMYSSLQSSITFTNMLTTVSISVLLGVQLSFVITYIRRAQTGWQVLHRAHAASVAGMVAGLFGVGCAACGSVIVSGLLSFIGANGLLLLLPWHGQEFGLLGIGLLLWSIYFVARKLQSPLVCK